MTLLQTDNLSLPVAKDIVTGYFSPVPADHGLETANNSDTSDTLFYCGKKGRMIIIML